jgi:hypothetical protein
MQYGKFAVACQIKFSPAIAGWLELADGDSRIPINGDANSNAATRILPHREIPDFILACLYEEMIDLKCRVNRGRC